MKENTKIQIIVEKVFLFHNFFTPMLIFGSSFTFLFAYGFTLKGIINFMVMIYGIFAFTGFIIVSSNTKDKFALKQQEITKLKEQIRNDEQ